MRFGLSHNIKIHGKVACFKSSTPYNKNNPPPETEIQTVKRQHFQYNTEPAMHQAGQCWLHTQSSVQSSDSAGLRVILRNDNIFFSFCCQTFWWARNENPFYSETQQSLSTVESKFSFLYSIKLKLIKLNAKLWVSNITEIHRVNKPIAQG